MKRRLSESTDKKEYIREVWKTYISKFIERKPQDENYDDFSILTITTSNFLDVKKYLEIENLTIDNIVAVTDQGQLKSEFELLLEDLGRSRNEVNRFFFPGKVESFLLKNSFKKPMDIYNLDYSGLFFSPSRQIELTSLKDPQGISHFFDYTNRFDKAFTLFFTSKINISPDRELFEYTELNNFLAQESLERITILDSDPDSVRLKSLVAILASVCTIAVTRGFRVKRIFPFIYRPEGTYTIQMTILEFYPKVTSIVQSYLELYNLEDIQILMQAIRDSIPRIVIIE